MTPADAVAVIEARRRVFGGPPKPLTYQSGYQRGYADGIADAKAAVAPPTTEESA